MFADPFAIGEFDDRSIHGEERFTITGVVEGVLLFVAYMERDDRVRINFSKAGDKT